MNLKFKDPKKTPEGWVRKDITSTIYLHFPGTMWVEFNEYKPVASFVEISRDNTKRQISLQNDIQKQNAKHNFVVLNPTNAFEGPTKAQQIRIYDGSYFNFGKFIAKQHLFKYIN